MFYVVAAWRLSIEDVPQSIRWISVVSHRQIQTPSWSVSADSCTCDLVVMVLLVGSSRGIELLLCRPARGLVALAASSCLRFWVCISGVELLLCDGASTAARRWADRGGVGQACKSTYMLAIHMLT